MRFDWQQDSKERYFRIAEEQIEAAGFSGFLCVDRSQFGVIADRAVKVYMQPIHHSGNMREWWLIKKIFPEFREIPSPRDQFGRKKKPIYLRGYLKIEMEANKNEYEICTKE